MKIQLTKNEIRLKFGFEPYPITELEILDDVPLHEVINETPLISNIWVSDNFKSKIGEYQSGGKPLQGHFHTLEKDMYDKDIIKTWNIAPLSLPDFWATLAPLLEKQKNGEEGTLLNNGYGNLFSITIIERVLVVSAWWDSGDSKWYLYVYELDEFGKWRAGFVVFAPATV